MHARELTGKERKRREKESNQKGGKRENLAYTFNLKEDEQIYEKGTIKTDIRGKVSDVRSVKCSKKDIKKIANTCYKCCNGGKTDEGRNAR